MTMKPKVKHTFPKSPKTSNIRSNQGMTKHHPKFTKQMTNNWPNTCQTYVNVFVSNIYKKPPPPEGTRSSAPKQVPCKRRGANQRCTKRNGRPSQPRISLPTLYVYIRTCFYALSIYVCVNINVIYIYIYVYIYTYKHIYTCICIYIYIWHKKMCLVVDVYVYIYIYIYINLI